MGSRQAQTVFALAAPDGLVVQEGVNRNLLLMGKGTLYWHGGKSCRRRSGREVKDLRGYGGNTYFVLERVWGAFRHTGRFGSITTLDRGNFEAPLLEVTQLRILKLRVLQRF